RPTGREFFAMRPAKWVWLVLPIAMARGGSLPAWNVLDNPAFDHFYNLEYDQALAGFTADAAKHPESAATPNHIAQTILYRDMFREGTLQTEMLDSTNSFL